MRLTIGIRYLLLSVLSLCLMGGIVQAQVQNPPFYFVVQGAIQKQGGAGAVSEAYSIDTASGSKTITTDIRYGTFTVSASIGPASVTATFSGTMNPVHASYLCLGYYFCEEPDPRAGTTYSSTDVYVRGAPGTPFSFVRTVSGNLTAWVSESNPGTSYGHASAHATWGWNPEWADLWAYFGDGPRMIPISDTRVVKGTSVWPVITYNGETYSLASDPGTNLRLEIGVLNNRDFTAYAGGDVTVTINGGGGGDADGDGVADSADLCPDTVEGATVDENGCSDAQRDSDNDGVADDKDLCPGTPSGESVDIKGCSATQQIDADGDGVPNDIDLCPGTPSGYNVDNNGCSIIQQPPIARLWPAATRVSVPVELVGKASFDPDGGSIVEYKWEVQTPSGTPYTVAGPSPVLPYSWDTAGQYLVTLTVTDDEGMKGKESITVPVYRGIEIVDVQASKLPPIEMGHFYDLYVLLVENDPRWDGLVTTTVTEAKEPKTKPLGDEVEEIKEQVEQMTPGVKKSFHFSGYKHSWEWTKPLIEGNGCLDHLKWVLLSVGPGAIAKKAKIYEDFLHLFSLGMDSLHATNSMYAEFVVNGYLVPVGHYQYQIQAYDGIDTANRSFDVSVEVPQYKTDALKTYHTAGMFESFFSATGTIVPWPTWKIVMYSIEALALGLACASYDIAVDPDPNYMLIADLELISFPTVKALAESTGKRIAQGWIEMLQAEKAMGKSLGRYEGAKAAGDQQWMGLQLEAAQKYHGIFMNALTEVKNSTPNMIQELQAQGFNLTQADIDNVSAQFLTDGLPQVEKDILAQIGFSHADIATAGQVSGGMMKYLPMDWQTVLSDSVRNLIEIQEPTGDWIEGKIAALGQFYVYAKIDIKPGSFPNSINPGSKGKIPVAILSTPTFSAPAKVDTTSLTFGRTGDESSLAFCNTAGEDVNGDGLLDLVCHFNTQQTGFQNGGAVGVLQGKTVEGTTLVGADSFRSVH